MRTVIPLFIALTLSACVREPVPDRAESPEAAFQAARAGLKNHDLHTYYDSLTEAAVRGELRNSVMICLAKDNPQAAAAGIKPSFGCESILRHYNWPDNASQSPESYRAAIAKIQDPRAMVEELEGNHRIYGAGSSVSWDYLDNVKITDVVISGSQAKAIALWGDDEKRPVAFQRDATGWRFDPKLENDEP